MEGPVASEVKRFGHVREVMPPPNLMKLQVESYARFLQVDLPSYERVAEGLEGILQEIFPIDSYNGEQRLEYLGYDLGRPRYSPDDCRKLRQTYGMPFKIRVRLAREGQANEEDVYLGEIPMMIGGGEFLINGSERVIVSQLHRSPGVDFDKEIHASDKILHKCRIIPERGSWIEVNVSKRDALTVRIDQSGKFPVTCLLRALFQEYATNEDIIRLFYETETVDLRRAKGVDKITGKVVVSDIIDPNTGEEKAASGTELSEQLALDIKESGCEKVEVVKEVNDWLVLNTLKEDGTSTHEEALLKI
jgi:DNA-directed RNA polymerase subunit beta